MKELMKHAGVILVLIGVVILAVPQFMHTMTNGLLLAGLIVIILGIIATIVLNKVVE